MYRGNKVTHLLVLGISKVPGFHGGAWLSGYTESEDAGANWQTRPEWWEAALHAVWMWHSYVDNHYSHICIVLSAKLQRCWKCTLDWKSWNLRLGKFFWVLCPWDRQELL